MRTRQAIVIMVAAIAVTLGLALPGSVAAQGSDGDFCSILTEAEVAAATGADVQVGFGDDISCEWESISGSEYFTLDAEHHVESIDDSGMKHVGTGAGLEVAGDPAYFVGDSNLLLVDLPGGGSLWLSHGGFPIDGIDPQAELTGLAALALPRLAQRTLPTPMVQATPATGDFCSILTEDEVVSAMATTMNVFHGSDTSCAWRNDPSEALLRELDAQYLPYSIDGSGVRQQEAGVDVEVAGRAGYFMKNYKLRVDLPDGGSLELKHTGQPPEGVDLQALLVGLAGIALPRVEELFPPLPTASPTASG